MAINITFAVGNFPNGYCWTGPQPYANDLVSLLIGTVAGNFSGVIISSTAPAVSDQDKLWVRTDANGKPIGLFLFLGEWIWPNPREPSGDEWMVWGGTAADLDTYDGGSVGAITETTGPMWQIATEMIDRFAQGVDAGDEQVNSGGGGITLAQSDLPNVGVGLNTTSGPPVGLGTSSDIGTGSVLAGTQACVDINTFADRKELLTKSLNGGVTQTEITAPLPPNRTVLFARRTARVYYTAS